MPVQKQQSGLLAKMGNRLKAAQQEHKGREPEVGSPQVPAGIEGGIAQLTKCQIGVFEKGANVGKPFFLASGSIKTPSHVTVDGHTKKVEGLSTQIGPEPLCDTPTATGKRKTFSDHYGYMRDQLKILGFDIDGLEGTPEQIEAQILAGMATLKKQGPHFNFRTWKGSKTEIVEENGKWFAVTGSQRKGPFATKDALMKAVPYANREPNVIHEWNGKCEPPNVNGEVVTPGEGAVEDGTPDVTDETATTDTDVGDVEQTEETESNVDADGALSDLCAKADAKDKAAMKKVKELALAAGVSEEDVDNADSWADVIPLMEAAQAAQGGDDEKQEEEEEEEQAPPEKGDVLTYFAPDKSGKPGKKGIQIEVVTVNKKSDTCTVKRLDTKAVIKDVAFDCLKAAE